MRAKDFIAKVKAMAEPVCAENGLSLWDVTFEKEGASYVLTVYIDRDEGVFIEDCEKVSRTIDPMLDAPEFDSLPSYVLTVSSAGLERKLSCQEHYAWAKGKSVELTFYKAIEGASNIIGILESHENGEFAILCGEEKKIFTDAQVAGARLHFEF